MAAADVCSACEDRPVENKNRGLCKRCVSWVYYWARRVIDSPDNWDRYVNKIELANTRMDSLDGVVDEVIVVRQEKAKRLKAS